MGQTLSRAAAAMLLMALCGGCSMCQQCGLDSYSAYGGRWQRTDREHGRVGSVFAPAGFLVASTDPVGTGVAEEAESDAADAEPREAQPDEGSEAEDGAATVPPRDAQDGEVFPSEEERDARERRLRELELEDIRYQH